MQDFLEGKNLQNYILIKRVFKEGYFVIYIGLENCIEISHACILKMFKYAKKVDQTLNSLTLFSILVCITVCLT